MCPPGDAPHRPDSRRLPYYAARPPGELSSPHHGLPKLLEEVAELAQQGFTDYAGAVSRLQATIPAAVVAFLRQEGLQAREEVVPQIRRTIEEGWQTQSSGVFRTDETVISRDL
jgi:hypothetical protein